VRYVVHATPPIVCGVGKVLCLYKSLGLGQSDNQDYLVRVVVVSIKVARLWVGHGLPCVGVRYRWGTEIGS